MLWIAATACGAPMRIVVVPSSEAAELSSEYHDRVMVLGIKRPQEPFEEVTGVLVNDGASIVTWRNKTIPVAYDDKLKMRIDYIEGDPALAGGVVHKRVSEAKMGGGVVLGILGTVGLVGSIVGASNCGPTRESGWLPNFGPALCGVAWVSAGGIALAATAAGIGLAIRGSLKTNLTVSPIAQPKSGGGSLRIEF